MGLEREARRSNIVQLTILRERHSPNKHGLFKGHGMNEKWEVTCATALFCPASSFMLWLLAGQSPS